MRDIKISHFEAKMRQWGSKWPPYWILDAQLVPYSTKRFLKPNNPNNKREQVKNKQARTVLRRFLCN